MSFMDDTFHRRQQGGEQKSEAASSPPPSARGVLKVVIIALLVIFLIIAAFLGGCAGIKTWKRAQRRADANNQVQVTKIEIRNQKQQVEVVKQKAQQRIQEAIGIRGAQDHIAKTLTPLYLQWEAIQAQLAMAHSQNHTMIWAPTGANGVPLVSTVQLQSLDNLKGTGK